MRRLTGIYDGHEHVILEYAGGHVECPSDLRAVLTYADGTMPTGDALEQALRELCGETVTVREVD